MKAKTVINLAGLLLAASVLGGCATSRSVIDASIPAANEAPQLANGQEVFINVPTDSRVFEVSPSEPSIPSLDPSENSGDLIKARAIGRKRNSFGKALGDILLPEGQTVATLTMASIRQAFQARGYRVLDDKEKISSKTYVVDTDLQKFWSWMNPGFWAITLSTEISASIGIKRAGDSEHKSVSVKASDTFQTGAESNWSEVMKVAQKMFTDDLKDKLK
ncbi:MAG: hypothetical protein JWP38_1343 [Herbaspirillum sp.]|nr:hypothetical protein [Herbaspirillum sp.]